MSISRRPLSLSLCPAKPPAFSRSSNPSWSKVSVTSTPASHDQFVTQAATLSPSNASQQKHADPTKPISPTLRIKIIHWQLSIKSTDDVAYNTLYFWNPIGTPNGFPAPTSTLNLFIAEMIKRSPRFAALLDSSNAKEELLSKVKAKANGM